MNTTNDRTGVFRLAGESGGGSPNGDGDGVVVYWRGREIARYASMAAFVAEHVEGLRALEQNQEKLLADAYRDKL